MSSRFYYLSYLPEVASTVCSSKGQALQLTSGLDFLSIQAYRLWMEHPSRGKVIDGRAESPTDAAKITRAELPAAAAANYRRKNCLLLLPKTVFRFSHFNCVLSAEWRRP